MVETTETLDPLPDSIYCGWYHVRFEYPIDINGARQAKVKPPCVDLNKLAACLPHGSGIDADWTVTVRRNGDVKCSASYHQMDEHGGYNGWVDFAFTLERAKVNRYVELRGSCIGQFQQTHTKGEVYFQTFTGAGKNHREYLYDTCYWAVRDLGIESMDTNIPLVTREQIVSGSTVVS